MATNSLKSLVISVLLIGLFAFGLISFGYNLQVSNSASTNIMQSEVVNSTFGRLTTQTEGYQPESNTSATGFYSETPPEDVGDAINLRSIISVVGGMHTLVTGTFTFLIQMLMITLGIGGTSAKIIMGTFSAIIIFSLILLAWSVIRSGR